MTISFDFFRNSSKKMRLTLAFVVAASSLHTPDLQTPQQQELQRLAQAYNKSGPLMPQEQFERMMALVQKETNGASYLQGAAFCAHGSGGAPASGSSSVNPACPHNMRRKKGDLSHLLAIDHLSYYM